LNETVDEILDSSDVTVSRKRFPELADVLDKIDDDQIVIDPGKVTAETPGHSRYQGDEVPITV
jgi:arginine/lysine/ornithine decarboxylase